MSCVPTDFFDLARRLAQESASEAELRCAISRAYYSALHSADIVFPKGANDFRREGESSHTEIINRVYSYSVQKPFLPGRTHAAVIAKHLNRLRRERNSADYNLDIGLGYSAATSVIERVQCVLNNCSDVHRLRSQANEQ